MGAPAHPVPIMHQHRIKKVAEHDQAGEQDACIQQILAFGAIIKNVAFGRQ